MRHYLIAIIAAIGLAAICCIVSSARQGHADYVQAMRGSHL